MIRVVLTRNEILYCVVSNQSSYKQTAFLSPTYNRFRTGVNTIFLDNIKLLKHLSPMKIEIAQSTGGGVSVILCCHIHQSSK